MIGRVDVADYDDTELGAEVRAAFAQGITILSLFDGSRRYAGAEEWPDGTHGLWRMRCAKEHVWLSARNGGTVVQRNCPTCGQFGEPMG